MVDDERHVNELALLVARGELSMTAYFEVVDERAERLVERGLRGLDAQITLRYPEVALLFASTIAVLLLAALTIAITS